VIDFLHSLTIFHMSLSTHDRKILWAKAGNKCSYSHNGENCDEILATQNGEEISLVGDEAHIVGGKLGSARYIKNFAKVDTNKNRILLCKKHHKLVDDNEDTYTVDILKSMKYSHEQNIENYMKNSKDNRLIIKDSVFDIHHEDSDEGIGMEVNRPAELSNVKLNYSSKNVKKSVGFSTNQGITSIIMTCPHCQQISPYVCTGPKPSKIICKHCEGEIDTN
jgi:hypothetical protein